MYAERFLIVVPSLARRNDPFIWHNYFPPGWSSRSWPGRRAMFLLLYTIFAKLFPIMAISDIKEHLFHTSDRKIGESTVESIAPDEGKERPRMSTVIVGLFEAYTMRPGPEGPPGLALPARSVTTIAAVPLPTGRS